MPQGSKRVVRTYQEVDVSPVSPKFSQDVRHRAQEMERWTRTPEGT